MRSGHISDTFCCVFICKYILIDDELVVLTNYVAHGMENDTELTKRFANLIISAPETINGMSFSLRFPFGGMREMLLMHKWSNL
jgi:hypothetical protein